MMSGFSLLTDMKERTEETSQKLAGSSHIEFVMYGEMPWEKPQKHSSESEARETGADLRYEGEKIEWKEALRNVEEDE